MVACGQAQCSIYGNKQAGEKLKQMLAIGLSKPWPGALKAVTGEDKMDATAIFYYFAAEDLAG